MQILSYSQTLNIGDAIQTIALQRLLNREVKYVDRNTCQFDPNEMAIVNGWLGRNVAPRNPNVLFAGIFLAENVGNIRWIKESRYAVGARDPYTLELLRKFGVAAQFVGCATLTLPKYDGPRKGEIHVESNTRSDVSHAIPSGMPWTEQLALGGELLEKYRTAKRVITSRLHVALPCLAFGTPVVVQASTEYTYAKRFSIFEALGVELDKETVLDVSKIADNYRRFVFQNL